MGFSRQIYVSGLSCPPPVDLPNPGIKLARLWYLLHWQAGSLPQAQPGKPFWAVENVLYLNMGWWLYRCIHIKFNCAFKIMNFTTCSYTLIHTHTHTHTHTQTSSLAGNHRVQKVHERSSGGERRCCKVAREERGAPRVHFAWDHS